jgi:hypothetical protein
MRGIIDKQSSALKNGCCPSPEGAVSVTCDSPCFHLANLCARSERCEIKIVTWSRAIKRARALWKKSLRRNGK